MRVSCRTPDRVTSCVRRGILIGMDPVRNPYAPGAGSPPPELAGRDEELDLFTILLDRLASGRAAKPILVYGLRGVGKTVLLRRFEEIARARSWAVASFEASSTRNLRSDLAGESRRLLLDLGRTGRARERLRALVRILHKFSLTVDQAGRSTVSVELDLDDVAATGNLALDLTAFFRELGEAAAEAEVGAVFLVDEVQALADDEMAALAMALHDAQQRALPVTIVAAGLPTALRRVGEAKSYTERLFDFRSIGRLEHAAARRALVEPARKEDVTFTPVARDTVLAAADGYPYFIQEYGKHAWNEATGTRIDARAANAGCEAGLAELDSGFFKVRTDKATSEELRVLAAIADLGDEPQSRAAVERRLGEPVEAQVASLEAKGLIYSTIDGELTLTAPHFADHLRRRHPL
jgi:hypothetical protein